MLFPRLGVGAPQWREVFEGIQEFGEAWTLLFVGNSGIKVSYHQSQLKIQSRTKSAEVTIGLHACALILSPTEITFPDMIEP